MFATLLLPYYPENYAYQCPHCMKRSSKNTPNNLAKRPDGPYLEFCDSCLEQSYPNLSGLYERRRKQTKQGK